MKPSYYKSHSVNENLLSQKKKKRLDRFRFQTLIIWEIKNQECLRLAEEDFADFIIRKGCLRTIYFCC